MVCALIAVLLAAPTRLASAQAFLFKSVCRARRLGLLFARNAEQRNQREAIGTPPASATPGDLDTTFGTDGKVITNFGFYTTRGHGLAMQADGKLLVAGGRGGFFWSGSIRGFVLVRFTASGALDLSRFFLYGNLWQTHTIGPKDLRTW